MEKRKFVFNLMTLVIFVIVISFSFKACERGDNNNGKEDPVALVYQWLYQQQDDNTGLLPSQEDDRASTYNNALAVMAFTLKSDQVSLSKAKRILNHFYDRRNEKEFKKGSELRGFYQFINSETGLPDTNSNRWMGDNAWLLMAIHHYKASTGDDTYDEMEENIVKLLESFQQPNGHIASGWENGDNNFNESGHAEGNLDAYKALLLSSKTASAEKVKHWLDFNDLDWEKGPLDLHSWRVLSLGADYGFSLNDTEQYKRTINYNEKEVTGFLPSSHLDDNIWTEGTGSMAVSFYKAGYKGLGDKYVSELGKLLFEPTSFPGTKTVAYLALPDPDNYDWVDTKKGHVAGACWYIFAKNLFDPFDGLKIDSFHIENPIYRIQAENYDTSDGKVRPDDRAFPYEGKALHIAGDNDPSCPNDDCSGSVEYSFKLLSSINNATISMRYAEDMKGDTCNIFLDDKLIKSFVPEDTGSEDTSGWDIYVWTDPFPMGIINSGFHTLRVEGIDKKTFGFTIDSFRIDGEATETNISIEG